MLEFIDANCRLGRGPAPREGAPNTTEEILALMDRFQVRSAVVYHASAQYAEIMASNRRLKEETRGSDRFFMQWAVLPPVWDLFPNPEALLDEMEQNGVNSVRMFPAQFGHSMKRYAAGTLLDTLAAHRIPVFLPFEQIGNWDTLYELCETYPDVRFVLCSPGYRCLRWLVPIMDRCPNLYVETSNFLMHNGFRLFCANMGADRLVFGSGMPEASLAAAASQLLLSDISQTEKEQIAGGNILRLLSEVAL